MKYEQIKELRAKEFLRLTGITIDIFNLMVNILKKEDEKKKAKGGRKSKLIIEDQLLMTLEYWREYRTYFHIGINYGISESSAYKGIKWVEDVLIHDNNFALPGKKVLSESNTEYEIILIDTTETPIQRPKKNNKNITPVKRNSTP